MPSTVLNTSAPEGSILFLSHEGGTVMPTILQMRNGIQRNIVQRKEEMHTSLNCTKTMHII